VDLAKVFMANRRGLTVLQKIDKQKGPGFISLSRGLITSRIYNKIYKHKLVNADSNSHMVAMQLPQIKTGRPP